MLFVLSCNEESGSNSILNDDENNMDTWFHSEYRSGRTFFGSCTLKNLTTGQILCKENWHEEEGSGANIYCEDEINYEKTFSLAKGCGLENLVGVCGSTIVDVYGSVTGAYSDTYYYSPTLSESVARNICAGYDNSYNDDYYFVGISEM
ncbi:hypothetical protein ACFL20_01435 [Spirochaetota bacterium]